MIHKINWGELPRICTHNINHILQAQHSSCTEQLHRVQLELQQELPDHIQAMIFFSHLGQMHTGQEKYSLPSHFYVPLNHFANIHCPGFSHKSSSFFRKVLNYIPTNPTLVFWVGEEERTYLILEGPNIIECAHKKRRKNSWFRLLQQIHKSLRHTQQNELHQTILQHQSQSTHLLEFGHDLKNRLRHNPTHPQIQKDISSFLEFQNSFETTRDTYFSLSSLQDEVFSFYHLHKTQITWPQENPNVQLCGNKSKIFRAILNIMDNAIDAAGPEGNITYSFEHKKNIFQINIQDSGPGISPDLRLFQPFSSQKGSSGLGLAMSKKWLIAMGGDLQLKNAKPTTFSISVKASS